MGWADAGPRGPPHGPKAGGEVGVRQQEEEGGGGGAQHHDLATQALNTFSILLEVCLSVQILPGSSVLFCQWTNTSKCQSNRGHICQNMLWGACFLNSLLNPNIRSAFPDGL